MNNRLLVPAQPPIEPEGFLRAAALDTVSAVTTAMSNPAALVHSGVRLVRAIQRGSFLDQLGREWEQLKADGKIADDYGATDQCRTAFADILASLEDADFDQEQLDVLRKLFLAAASESLTDRASPLPRMYLAIGRGLSSGEIELLGQTYRYTPEWVAIDPAHRPSAAENWLNEMRQRTGLKHIALIELEEQKLMDKNLLRKRLHGDRSGIATSSTTYRLTDLGVAFCEFLASYDDLKAAEHA